MNDATLRPLTRKKVLLHTALGLFLAVIALLLFPTLGGDISLKRALADGPWNTSASPDAMIFWSTRIPRVILALLVGGSLAVAGLVCQSVLRNPLAEPYILGISGGAAFGKMVAVILGLRGTAYLLAITPLFCFAGALLPLFVLYSLSSMSRRMSHTTLLLGGIMLNVFFTSVIVLLQYFADLTQVRQMFLWSMGALDVVGYREIMFVLPITLLLFGVLLMQTRAMNLLTLDAVSAAHLGLNVKRTSNYLLLIAAFLTSLMVAVSGPIGFVGLIVPHALRLIFSSDNRLLAPLCMVYGGVFLAVCDFIGWRGMELMQSVGMRLVQVSEIPVGVITSVLGGPFFFFLLMRSARRREA
jgi:iron complex transport system permease protein